MGTREGIFNLLKINERYLEDHKDVYTCFIDYVKAFDRVKHEKLCDVLKAMTFDGKDIRLIANLYWGQAAVVRTTKRGTQEILLLNGESDKAVCCHHIFSIY